MRGGLVPPPPLLGRAEMSLNMELRIEGPEGAAEAYNELKPIIREAGAETIQEVYRAGSEAVPLGGIVESLLISVAKNQLEKLLTLITNWLKGPHHRKDSIEVVVVRAERRHAIRIEGFRLPSDDQIREAITKLLEDPED